MPTLVILTLVSPPFLIRRTLLMLLPFARGWRLACVATASSATRAELRFFLNLPIGGNG
jgi:hypothetical protein